MPDAGHLQHMPTHIDVLCGDYQRVIADNEQAIVADDRSVERAGRLNFYSLYRVHDHHFRIYGAMFPGQRRSRWRPPTRWWRRSRRSCCGSSAPDGGLARRLRADEDARPVRFGMWEELIALGRPRTPSCTRTTTAMTHYGRASRWPRRGRVEEAEAERELFAAAVTRVPETRYL